MKYRLKNRLKRGILLLLFAAMFLVKVDVRAADFSKPYPLPVLTGDWRDDFVAVANSQLGYKEAADGSSFFGNWGGDAYQDWCSEFAAWCASSADIPPYIIPKAMESKEYLSFFASIGQYYYIDEGINRANMDYMNEYSFEDISTVSPWELESGDIVLKESNQNVADGPDHTAIVLEYDSESEEVKCISGNSSDMVQSVSYKIKELHGVCKPEFIFDGILEKYGNTAGDAVLTDLVTSIAPYSFSDCKNIKSVSMTDSVYEIGEYAFQNCKGLKKITIPDGVTSIGNGAFKNCQSLESITIPDGVSEISEELFAGCSSLKTVSLPETISDIGSRAFAGCKSLEKITIPSDVVNIEENAFDNTGSNLTIIGEKDSEVKNYAKEHNIQFVAAKDQEDIEDEKTDNNIEKPGKIRWKRIVAKKKSVCLYWNQIEDVDGYVVYMKKSPKGKYKKISTIRSSSKTLFKKKDLKRRKKYYFKIRAYRVVEDTLYYGKYSAQRGVRTK